MKFLIYTIILLLFFAACTCDAEYVCEGEEEYLISYQISFNGFSQEQRDNLILVLHSNNNDEIISTYPIGRQIIKTSSNGYIYNLDFPLLHYDLRTHYYVFQMNNLTDTLSHFHYDTRDTIFNCYGGCRGGSATQNYTIYDDFYFLNKNDTIRKNDDLIIF